MSDTLHPLLADAVLALHVAIVVFVGGGLFAIIAGNLRNRRWVNAPHLVALDKAGARFERGVLIERPEPAAA